MPRTEDLQLFLKTAECGSFSAAALALDTSPAVASVAVKRLEQELGVGLFARTTRSLRLTREGEAYLEHARAAMDALNDGKALVESFKGNLQGRLRLSLPSDLGRNTVLPWLDEFQERHPQVNLRLQVTDRVIQVYRQPVDLTLRYGVPADSGLCVLPVAPANRRLLVASPAYVARHGAPQTPEEAARHPALLFMLGNRIHDQWQFCRGRQQVSIKVNPGRVADDGDVVRRWAVAGHGLAYKSALDVAADLAAGRLQVLLPDWQGEAAPLNLVCPDRRHISPLVRELQDFLAERCGGLQEIPSNNRLTTRKPSGN